MNELVNQQGNDAGLRELALFAGAGGESSAGTYLDGEQSAPSSTTPTPDQYYWPDKTTEHSRLSRFGMTCVRFEESRGEDLLTWYRAGFPARTSAQQGPAPDLTASAAGYGQKWHGLLARYDRDTSSWKTPQCSLLGGLGEFSETWPRWGSMRNGELLERITPMLPTKETGFGFLPTPTASNTKGIAQRGSDKGKARDPRSYGASGPLNPPFLEWLMGWPMGWTELKPLATDRLAEWRQQHSASYPANEP